MRIIISLLGGLVFPFLYTVIAGALTGFFPNYFSDSKLYGENVPGIIYAPTMFPFYFWIWLKANNFFGWYMFFDTFWFRLVLVVMPNILLYFGLTYLALWLLRFPRRKQYGSNEPPPLHELNLYKNKDRSE